MSKGVKYRPNIENNPYKKEQFNRFTDCFYDIKNNTMDTFIKIENENNKLI